MPNFRPYSFEQNGHILGLAMAPVESTLQKMNIPYSITLYDNYSLLFKALKNAEIDGAFLASQNLDRDRIADFSTAVLFNNWSWIQLVDSPLQLNTNQFLRDAKVATVENTNTYRWLIRRGYRVTAAASSALPELLFSKKVDAIFASQAVFDSSLKQSQYKAEPLSYTVEIAQPFGLYVSKDYRFKFPDFLARFNSHFTK